MRFLLIATGVLLAGMSAGALGARWLGQATAGPTLPLPENGCWSAVCPFAGDRADVVAALTRDERTTDVTVSSQPGQNWAVQFAHEPGPDQPPLPLIGSMYYTDGLIIDGSVGFFDAVFTLAINDTNPAPLMSLGDLLVAAGPPTGLSVSPYFDPMLVYPGRFWAVVAPHPDSATPLRLTPDLPVYRLVMSYRDWVGLAQTSYQPWPGLGRVTAPN